MFAPWMGILELSQFSSLKDSSQKGQESCDVYKKKKKWT